MNTEKTSMEDYYLNSAKDMYEEMKRTYLAGASIGHMENNTITAWFNRIPYHTAPLTINLVHNAIARAMIAPGYSIDVTNEPVPFTPESIEYIEKFKILLNKINGILTATGLCFGMAYVTAFYVMFYIKVKRCKKKTIVLLRTK